MSAGRSRHCCAHSAASRDGSSNDHTQTHAREYRRDGCGVNGRACGGTDAAFVSHRRKQEWNHGDHTQWLEPSRKGPAEYFTGAVRIDPLFAPPEPARASAGRVTFEPGARTAWHTHPVGQMLIIVSGLGWVQREGGPIEEVRPGDVVWFPASLKHWHGATPTTAMTHIAIQEAVNGKNVDWMEKVSDEQYRK